MQRRMRRAHRAFRVIGGRRPREDESQIASRFRQCLEQLIDLRGNPHVLDAGDPARRIFARHTLQQAAPGDRDHHHGRRVGLPREPFDRLANGMAQQDFLERATTSGTDAPRE